MPTSPGTTSRRTGPSCAPDSAKCLHYYFYFIDAELGLIYLRVPTPACAGAGCGLHSGCSSTAMAPAACFASCDDAAARVRRSSCPSPRQSRKNRVPQARACREADRTPCRDRQDLGDDGADRYRRFFDRIRGAVCAFDGGRPRRKCPQLRPIPARHRADFGRPGGIHCFAAAAEVRASPPCPAVGGRTASAARCGHVVATGPARLCTSAVDEQLRVRGRRRHPAPAPGYRLECRHAQSRAAEDRRRLHAAAAAVGGQGACVLPARRPAAEHPAPYSCA